TDNGYVLTGLRGGAYDPDTGLFAPVTLSSHQGWQDVEYFVNQFNALADITTGSLRHSLIIGAEYSDLKVINGVYEVTNAGATNCVTAGRGGLSPNYCITDENRNVIVDDLGGMLQRQIVRGGADSTWEVETFSAYVMDTIDVTPWLTVHGGFRIDAFDYANAVNSRGTLSDYTYSDTLWNGHAGVVLKPTTDGMFYFSWGTSKNINGGESDLGGNCGYGGVCVVDGVTDVGDGKPESSTNLELGTKWELFDHHLLLTAALFQLTKDDVFESGNEDSYSNFGSLNTGKHRIRGVEVGLVGNITEKLSGQIGATFMKSKILRTIATPPSSAPAGSSYIGKRLSNFANRHVTGQLRYQATPAFAFGGTATYKGKMYTGQPDTAAGYDFDLDVYTNKVPSYWVFDAFASYKINQNFSARLNVTNVGDKDYYLAGYRSGHFLYKGDERRVALTLSGRF
ncbi:MAG: TonB-dependent receptor, partial [Novosphingobium sp.]|nr:TonB-dependent receptor [Novosphingobium sp.]